ncbi:MAG: endonuclease [Desulfobacterales bacterium]
MKNCFVFIYLTLFLFISSLSFADCRGCCSGHGGVTCVNGITMCKDGTGLSEKCKAKCDKCGTGTVSDSPAPATSQPASSAKPKTGKKAGSGNISNDSFNKAKKSLERQVYADHRITFYCGCPFDQGKNVLSCDRYTPKSDSKRSRKVEWEHVVPAAHFGQSFKEWRDGHPDCVDGKGKPFKGRNCASKVAIPYRYMESDMYNLVPAIGEVNRLRSNFRFDMISGESREFGACDMEIDSQARVAEPPERVRGDIARTYKYMNQAYPGHGIIGRSSVKLFDAWDRQDPVDQWECERCRRIEAIQGNENPVVKEACKAAGLW